MIIITLLSLKVHQIKVILILAGAKLRLGVKGFTCAVEKNNFGLSSEQCKTFTTGIRTNLHVSVH